MVTAFSMSLALAIVVGEITSEITGRGPCSNKLDGVLVIEGGVSCSASIPVPCSVSVRDELTGTSNGLSK